MSDTNDQHDYILRLIPQCDVLLHCGDITESESLVAIEQALGSFSESKADLKLFLTDNHEISLGGD